VFQRAHVSSSLDWWLISVANEVDNIGRVVAQASHRGGPGSIPGHVMWCLWFTKWQWDRFSPSTSISPANSHSTKCFTFIIIYPARGWHNRPVGGRRTKWTQTHLTPRNETKTKLRGFSPQANYTDRTTTACRRS
jgi:hypothetical protein